MKVKHAAAAALLALLAVLAACSPISEGIIDTKEHKPGWWQTVWDQQCIQYDKDFICKMWIPVSRQVYHPPTWKFSLYDFDDPSITGWVYVSENTYNDYEEGQRYP